MDKIPYPNNVHMEAMTLRDYFAARAMQALITRETRMHPNPLMYAGAAYDIADAMLEERVK
jgi:hypothetical protein